MQFVDCKHLWGHKVKEAMINILSCIQMSTTSGLLSLYLAASFKRKQPSPLLEILQNCLTPLEIPRSKTNTHGNSTWIFLEHPCLGISTSFLTDSWNFHMLFLQYPSKFHVLTSTAAPVLVFGFFLE